MVLEVENGKIWELGAKKHVKYEAELRRKITAEVRKQVEAEAELKLADAKAKI